MPKPLAAPAPKPVFALLSGGGALPAALCTAAQARGWPVHVVTFTGQPQPQGLPSGLASQTEKGLGQVGAILKHLRGQGVTHVAMGGHLSKPGILSLKPDLKGVALLALAAKNGTSKHGGSSHDDALLRTVAGVLAEEGFIVLSTEELVPQLIAPATPARFGKTAADTATVADIHLGFDVLKVLGQLDIGQAAVVHKGTILGVEAVEGTNALIARCAALRGPSGENGKGGVLVKMAKPGQTRAADLPTVGPETLEQLIKHNYIGLAVQAGSTLLLELDTCVKHADQHKLVFQSFEV